MFKELKILKFGGIYLFDLGMFMFSYRNDLLSDAFDSFFQPINRTHQVPANSISRFAGIISDDFLGFFQGPN